MVVRVALGGLWPVREEVAELARKRAAVVLDADGLPCGEDRSLPGAGKALLRRKVVEDDKPVVVGAAWICRKQVARLVLERALPEERVLRGYLYLQDAPPQMLFEMSKSGFFSPERSMMACIRSSSL